MIEPIAHLGWPNCVRMTNGAIELIATTDVGPRILYFGFAGQRNLFKVFDNQAGLIGGDEWRIYGGHRLWHAPERKPWTYAPDNEPVEWRAENSGTPGVAPGTRALRIILHQPAHPLTNIAKSLDITLAGSRPEVSIIHRLTNEGTDAIELAPWALTAMAPGGTAVLPLPERGPHNDANLLPVGSIILWPYTDLADPRLSFDSHFVRVRQDSQVAAPFKIGLTSHGGWCAYVNDGVAFVKRSKPVKSATYPDRGAQIAVFTNADMLELETLGPLVTLRPGELAEHEERWELLRVQSRPGVDDVLRQFAG